jgi:membrane-bound ClpP family serine protease
VATTHLRPAGKAEIEHRLIDVIAEGEPIDQGTRIVVVDARGNRVLVRAERVDG